MEKWPNAKSVIKLKASITIQVRVTCGGLLVGLMQPIHPTGGPQTVHLLNPMSKLVPHLGRASKAHPSTKVSDCVHHGCCNMCMVVYARRRLSVMKGRRIKVVKARGLTSEVVLPHTNHKKMNLSCPVKKIGRFLSWELISILKELIYL